MINFSNHPSDRWGELQLKAAAGKVVDVPFPAVNPMATAEELDSLAAEYVGIILGMNDPVVHVMGEMGLVYRVVALLKQHGITAVHSTSERVSEEKNGIKTSVFTFRQFRKY